VWSTRMLTALTVGVKGGRWFSLIDKIWREPVLEASWADVKANKGAPGIDGQRVKDFGRHEKEEIAKLHRELLKGSYQPKPVKRVLIEKAGCKEKRPLGIPTVRDRVVQGAVRKVIEPIFENLFAEHSYGFRPGRGAKDALRRVEALRRARNHWTVDADLKGYFDSIPHDQLMDRVREHVADGRVLELLEKFLKAGVMETCGEVVPTVKGTPQGAVLSPMLANLYLNELDHLMAEKGYEMTRYADDFVIQCKSEEEANAALNEVKKWVERNGLQLHPGKTCIVDVGTPDNGFDFLGYHFTSRMVKRKHGDQVIKMRKWMRWPRAKSLKRMRTAIKLKTLRTNGTSIVKIVQSLNRTIRGWFGYFKHSHPSAIRAMDSYIRGRLRSILRKRRGGKG